MKTNNDRLLWLLFAHCHFERRVPASVAAVLRLDRAFAAAAAAAVSAVDSAGWDRALLPRQTELWPTVRM